MRGTVEFKIYEESSLRTFAKLLVRTWYTYGVGQDSRPGFKIRPVFLNKYKLQFHSILFISDTFLN